MKIDATLNRVRAWVKTARASGVPLVEICDRAVIGINSLRHMDREDWNPNTKTLRKLEALIPDDFMPCRDNGPIT